ncbi:MAG: alkaline phosphatase family protein [Candidatus Micrarchaeota archaeon]|nr:alkaline phosphatase family protein [Candidatus Micrarchaeota archaeon]
MIFDEVRAILDRVRKNEEKAFVILADGLGGYPLNIPSATKKTNAFFPTSGTAFFYSLYTQKTPEHHHTLEHYTRGEEGIYIPLWGKDLNGNRVEEELEDDLFSLLEEEGIQVQHLTPYLDQPYVKRWGKAQPLNTLSQLYELPEKDFTFVNWPMIDYTLHKYGPYSPAFNQEIELLELTVKRLRKRLPPEVKIYVFGDHGLTESQQKIFLPEIEGNLPVGGERAAFYQLSYDEVANALENMEGVLVLEKEELEAVLGFPLTPEIKRRYGETAVIAERGYGFVFPYAKPDNVFSHGGLSKEERKILIYIL